MNHSVAQIITQNNHSIAMLQSGDEQTAVANLTNGLVSLKKILLEQGNSSAPANNNQSSLPTLHLAASLPEIANEGNYVYNKAINLAHVESDSLDILQLYTASIIYNLAVVHHRRWLVRCESSNKDKALKLYNTALRIVSSISDCMSGTALFLRLVVLNNLAQINFEEQDFSEAIEKLSCISELLSSEFPVLEVFTDDEWDGLLTNVMLLSPPVMAAAA